MVKASWRSTDGWSANCATPSSSMGRPTLLKLRAWGAAQRRGHETPVQIVNCSTNASCNAHQEVVMK